MIKNTLCSAAGKRWISKSFIEKPIQQFRFKSSTVFREKSSFSVKLCKQFFTNTTFKESVRQCKQPVILLSGILSLFGLKEKNAEKEEDELILNIKKGILHFQRKEYQKAEKILHSALQLAINRQDEDGITYIYDVLANLAFDRGQHDKAEKLFVSVLNRLLQNGEDQESNKVVNISLKLAKIFEDIKDYKKAEQGYKFCIEALDKKLETNDEDTLALWGMSMDWYGRFLLGINKKNDALNCFKKAYEMCVKVNGVEHEQTVILLNDLGTISSLIGDTDSALSYFEQAKEIGKKLPDMKDIASVYINLGQLYLLREMYKESKTACEEGMRKAKFYEDTVGVSEAQQCLENINRVFNNSNKSQKK